MEALQAALSLPEGATRTAAVVAWVQSLFAPGKEPILVGGGAVELYTNGAYTTGDIDLVGTVPEAVSTLLAAAGFTRTGRHWIHEQAQLFLEFPSSSLYEGEQGERRLVAGRPVLIISAEDLIAERLAAWQHWRSSVDGVNAWLVYASVCDGLDRKRLARQVRRRDASTAYRSLARLARRCREGPVAREELERWALDGP